MKTPEISLQHNCPLCIPGGGITVECLAGTVWLTNSRAAGDVFLRPGDRHQLVGGLTLVESLGTARIMLHPPTTLWRRIFSGIWGFLLSYAHGRASQYSGIYLRTV